MKKHSTYRGYEIFIHPNHSHIIFSEGIDQLAPINDPKPLHYEIDEHIENVVKREIINEKWYSFTRFYCKNGFIDCCCCSMSDNPNNEKQKQQRVTSNTRFFRLNNGVWKCKSEFERNVFLEIVENHKNWNAIDLFTVLLVA